MNTFNDFLQYYINSPETNIDYGIPTKVFCIMTFPNDDEVRSHRYLETNFYVLEFRLDMDNSISNEHTPIRYCNMSNRPQQIVFQYDELFWNGYADSYQWSHFDTGAKFKKLYREFKKTGAIPTKEDVITFRQRLNKGLAEAQTDNDVFTKFFSIEFGGFGTEYPNLNDFIEKYAIPFVETKIETAPMHLKKQYYETTEIQQYVTKLNENLQRLKQYNLK